jgi:hypothetical protein
MVSKEIIRAEIESLARGEHGAPGKVLGIHPLDDGTMLARVLSPEANHVAVLFDASTLPGYSKERLTTRLRNIPSRW